MRRSPRVIFDPVDAVFAALEAVEVDDADAAFVAATAVANADLA